MSATQLPKEITLINGRTVLRRKKKGIENRFWQKVERRGPDDCWPWKGGLKDNGYGQINDDPASSERVGRKLIAHRVAYVFAFGAIPSGLEVMHRCDNRACVNPRHLVLGTHQENMADMFRKGRHAHGERQPTRKLNRYHVRAIRWLARHDPCPDSELARHFAVSPSNITKILRGKAWRLDQ